MALLFLEGQQESCTGSRRKQEIKDLLDKIKATGFDYPTARKSCQLIDNKEKIRLFTEEAIDMVYQKVLAQWKKQI